MRAESMSLNKEFIALVILLLFVPYGWYSCLNIIRKSRSDMAYIKAEGWRKVIFNFYYLVGIVGGPILFGAMIYSLYTRYVKHLL